MAKKRKDFKIDWKSYIILFLLLVGLGMFALVVQSQTKSLEGLAYEVSRSVQCPDGSIPQVIDPASCRVIKSNTSRWGARKNSGLSDCTWQCVPVSPNPSTYPSVIRPTGGIRQPSPVPTRSITIAPIRRGGGPSMCPDIAPICDDSCTIQYDGGGCPVGCNCAR